MGLNMNPSPFEEHQGLSRFYMASRKVGNAGYFRDQTLTLNPKSSNPQTLKPGAAT